MQLTLIKNENYEDNKETLIKLSKIIYAETRASSLIVVESLGAMIANLCKSSLRSLNSIANDESIFECLNKDSIRHSDLLIAQSDPKFQMCLRTIKRMANGQLSDSVHGATRFHREDRAPEWSITCGNVAEVDGLLFYKD
jgi:adenosyl cobinamide kinase/adenosyl cobinamide phosphate guanylyltransferase